MKKIFLLLILSSFGFFATAQYFQATMKVELTTTGPEAVFSIKANTTITDGFSGVEFFITYPPSYSLSFGTSVANTTDFPGLSFIDGGHNSGGSAPSGNDTWWWYYTGTGTTSNTYTAGSEYEVLRVPITSSSVDFGDVSMEFDGSLYSAYFALGGITGTGYTTVDQNLDVPVYYGPGTYTGGNGDAVFAGGTCMYTITDQPLVPMVLWQSAAWAGGTGTGNSPGNGDGAKKCYIKDLSAQVSDVEAQVLDLIIETGGSLEIIPNAGLTALGPTTITDATSLIVQADATGVGSFIDNGTITYGTNGSAKVQTYLHNGQTDGTFWIHLVGPTVDITGAPGVTLGDFDLAALQTYAYQWDETLPLANGWVNVYNTSTPINTATGLALSTNDNTDHILEMTGKLLTGAVTTPLTFTTNDLMLISNPYPSAIDFDAFYSDNSSYINNQFWVWDESIGNYITRSGGVANQLNIQVGQGFFVETTGSTNADFNNTQRVHSNDPFREVQENTLHVTVDGGTKGYKDNAWIHFSPDGQVTSGYDVNYDGEKWASYYQDATSIWTVTEDSTRVQVNQLPLDLLQSTLASVPMSFVCGYAGEYTLHFKDIDSFDGGTEIWLEDLQTGGDWVDVIQNPDYTFTGNPQDLKARFVIHFAGPNSVNDIEAHNVKIYGVNEYAYVKNMTKNEVIKEVFIYSLSGRMILHKQVTDQNIYRFYISNFDNIYIIKVVTDKNIYTGKVFIH